jgi:CMP-N,N'-diacetyllegionaminic acid synthase
MYHNLKTIITICARGGSKSVPGKNIKSLAGKPLLAYTIEQAQSLEWVDRIVVSTDDEHIKKVAEEYGVEVPFLRPPELATDTSAKAPAIKHAIETSQSFWHESYDVVVDLDPTSPLRTLDDINASLALLTQPQTLSVFSVSESYKNPYFNMVEPDEKGYVHLSKTPQKPIFRRQDAPAVYSMNASIYVMRVSDFLKQNSFFTSQTRVHIMPEERSIDIDRPIDFEWVEFLMSKQH